MAMRSFAFVIIGLAGIALGGCTQETLEPSTQGGWKPLVKQLISKLPYQQAEIPDQSKRDLVVYSRKGGVGWVGDDSDNKFLYYVLPKGRGIRYGIAVGEEA